MKLQNAEGEIRKAGRQEGMFCLQGFCFRVEAMSRQVEGVRRGKSRWNGVAGTFETRPSAIRQYGRLKMRRLRFTQAGRAANLQNLQSLQDLQNKLDRGRICEFTHIFDGYGQLWRTEKPPFGAFQNGRDSAYIKLSFC